MEDFFQVRLVERQGKGVRLTASGRELARISRFFLLGLSNFQRGCAAEDQTYRIGAGPTMIRQLLLPVLAELSRGQSRIRFAVEPVGAEEIERRLQELTLDFGITNRAMLSRPLQSQALGRWRLHLWVPRGLAETAAQAVRAFGEKRLSLAWPEGELPWRELGLQEEYEPVLACDSFLEAKKALEQGVWAAFLPDFLPAPDGGSCLRVGELPAAAGWEGEYFLAWNPRLLRLNPHAVRRRDALVKMLSEALRGAARGESFSGSRRADGLQKRP